MDLAMPYPLLLAEFQELLELLVCLAHRGRLEVPLGQVLQVDRDCLRP